MSSWRLDQKSRDDFILIRRTDQKSRDDPGIPRQKDRIFRSGAIYLNQKIYLPGKLLWKTPSCLLSSSFQKISKKKEVEMGDGFVLQAHIILYYLCITRNTATWIGRKFYHSQHRQRVHITHNSQLNKENTQFWREEDYWRESCKYISVLVLLSTDQKLNFL